MNEPKVTPEHIPGSWGKHCAPEVDNNFQGTMCRRVWRYGMWVTQVVMGWDNKAEWHPLSEEEKLVERKL